MRLLFSFAIMMVSVQLAFCQQDSVPPVVFDTVQQEQAATAEEIEMYADQFVPRRASLYAALLPGAGQIYNRKYWKLPLVYGGFIGLGLAVDWYNDQYRLFRSELFKKLRDSAYIPISGASESQLRTAVDKARRERDFWIIMSGLFYLLQIVDAHIDAHLKEFDLNPRLKITMEPMLEQPVPATNLIGMSLKLKF